jgi:hypothetical protein
MSVLSTRGAQEEAEQYPVTAGREEIHESIKESMDDLRYPLCGFVSVPSYIPSQTFDL